MTTITTGPDGQPRFDGMDAEQLMEHLRMLTYPSRPPIVSTIIDALRHLSARVRELEWDGARFEWIATHGTPIIPGAPGIYPACGKGASILRRAVDAAMKSGC